MGFQAIQRKWGHVKNVGFHILLTCSTPPVSLDGLETYFLTYFNYLGFSALRFGLSAPKSQRFLRFAIAMPIAEPRNRAISETRQSNVALRFKGAMESR